MLLGNGVDAPWVRESTCRHIAALQPPAKLPLKLLVPNETSPAARGVLGTMLCRLHPGLAAVTAAWPNTDQIREPGLGKKRGKANRRPSLRLPCSPPSEAGGKRSCQREQENSEPLRSHSFIFPSMA